MQCQSGSELDHGDGMDGRNSGVGNFDAEKFSFPECLPILDVNDGQISKNQEGDNFDARSSATKKVNGI